ncbi:plasmid partitioning protein ParA [Clostridium acetobutylicum]|nr:plasmid partitioning protein ParA [Clostridium acetobutylicum]
MAKINLIIAETDGAYLKGLVNYISSNFEDTFRITCFTNREYLEKYISSGRVSDILLIKTDMFYEGLMKNSIKSIAILSEGGNMDEFNGLPVVKKYQPGEKLCREILNIYYNNNPEVAPYKEVKKQEGSIITLYSPVGGIGKSTIAIEMAKKLSDSNKKVLYLNLEDLQSTLVFFECSTSKNMSDFLYFIKERDENFKEVLKDIVLKDEESGINYFAPVDSVLDIEDLKVDDVKFMLQKLIEANMYNYIIIDLSSTFNINYKTIFEMSSKIIVPIGQDKLSSVKLQNFLKQLDNLENFSFIQNKYKDNLETIIPHVLLREKKPIIQKIYYDEALESVSSLTYLKNRASTFLRCIDELIMKLL